ncbi:hypothetical protein [Streptomyces xanthii]|uniref:AG1 protein n=1 Tax=Streptomyces xanthii TaxID=2768069 RepID=A0A7H1BK88_9ACTN|nr:hypothetical protein [Streptomyces xanthii]QNS09143.1 hypothetical protein IAG42_12775 [Streptomyces xanthii]
MAWDEWEELKAAAAERHRNGQAGPAAPPAQMRLNQLAPDGGGGGRPDIDIKTKGVHGAANDTETLSRNAMTRLNHSLDGSDDVYAYHMFNGWTSSVQLKVCALNWEEHMVSLAKQLGDLSAKLRDSANGFDGADAEAERRLNAAVRDLGKA